MLNIGRLIPKSAPVYRVKTENTSQGALYGVFYDLNSSSVGKLAESYYGLLERSRWRGIDTPKIFLYSILEKEKALGKLVKCEGSIRDELGFVKKRVTDMAAAGIKDLPEYQEWEEKEFFFRRALYVSGLIKETFYDGRFFQVTKDEMRKRCEPESLNSTENKSV